MEKGPTILCATPRISSLREAERAVPTKLPLPALERRAAPIGSSPLCPQRRRQLRELTVDPAGLPSDPTDSPPKILRTIDVTSAPSALLPPSPTLANASAHQLFSKRTSSRTVRPGSPTSPIEKRSGAMSKSSINAVRLYRQQSLPSELRWAQRSPVPLALADTNENEVDCPHPSLVRPRSFNRQCSLISIPLEAHPPHFRTIASVVRMAISGRYASHKPKLFPVNIMSKRPPDVRKRPPVLSVDVPRHVGPV